MYTLTATDEALVRLEKFGLPAEQVASLVCDVAPADRYAWAQGLAATLEHQVGEEVLVQMSSWSRGWGLGSLDSGGEWCRGVVEEVVESQEELYYRVSVPGKRLWMRRAVHEVTPAHRF